MRCLAIHEVFRRVVRESPLTYCHPPGKVHPAPEAINFLEASIYEHLFVEASALCDEHAF
jgi:hypothetical protein